MSVNFINLTPHKITIQRHDGLMIDIPTSGTVARVESIDGVLVEYQNNIPIYSADTYGEVVGLPLPVENTIYIVSSMVASHVPNRHDVVCPGTGPKHNTIRNASGQITAVTRLISAAKESRDICSYCKHDNGLIRHNGIGEYRIGYDCEHCHSN